MGQLGQKALQKVEYILENAEKVFIEKGFKNVTMKDIVVACNISRGGVYLYFNDTKEIFEAVLQLRTKKQQGISNAQMENDHSARAQMKWFLNSQKEELLNPADNLIIATYEYLFVHRAVKSSPELKTDFQIATTQLAMLIQLGVDNGEFFVEPHVAAQNIVLLLEGLRVSSTVLAFDAELLDHQIEYVISQLERRCSE